MKIVGITGRSGCGKSSVTKYLAALGYPCIDADQIARKVLWPGSPCLEQLQNRFGADILAADGTLQRRLLADRAFATPEGTQALTDITQPEILRYIEKELAQARDNGAEIAFVDGAVIVGSPFEKRCNDLWLITAPYEVSVARICARDGISPEMARRRLDAQTSSEILCAAATREIQNEGTPEQLYAKIRAILEALEKEAHG